MANYATWHISDSFGYSSWRWNGFSQAAAKRQKKEEKKAGVIIKMQVDLDLIIFPPLLKFPAPAIGSCISLSASAPAAALRFDPSGHSPVWMGTRFPPDLVSEEPFKPPAHSLSHSARLVSPRLRKRTSVNPIGVLAIWIDCGTFLVNVIPEGFACVYL